MDSKKAKIIRNAIDESIFIMWIRRNYGILLGAVIVSLFVGLISYPGVLYSDSYSRIKFTQLLDDSISAFLNGDASLYYRKMWLTVAPSFFILLSEKISGNIFMYTCIQAFCFLLSIYCVLGTLFSNRKQRLGVYILILIMPIVWGYSVYYEPSVGCITAILLAMILIQEYGRITNKGDKAVSLILTAICAFVAFGFRANAFTVIPVYIFIIIKRYHFEKKALSLLVSLLVGFFLTMIIPKLLNIYVMSSYSASFWWESISTIQAMDEDNKEKYLDYYDDLFGEGFTKQAIEYNTCKETGASINPLFGEDPVSICVIIDDNSSEIMKRYWRLIKEKPKDYLVVKFDMILHCMGMNKPLVFTEYDYDRWGQMIQFGFNDSKPRVRFVGLVTAFMRFMGPFLRPWILYVIALAMIIFCRIKFPNTKKDIAFYEELYLMAVFYYGAFLINTQSFEFRYFFPAWLMLVLIIISLVVKTASEITYKKKLLMWVGIVAVYAVAILGTYCKYVQNGHEMLRKVESEGKLLYYDGNYKVYILDDSLAYVTSWKANTDYTFLLRYYMTDGSIVSDDFSFADFQIDTSFFSDKIAMKEIPNDTIDYLETGQMYGITLFWGDRIELDE